MLPEIKKAWGGRINEVAIGATAAEGGTRGYTVKLGGASTLPFLNFEGCGGRPLVAMEIWDVYPEDWPDLLKEPFGDALKDPAAWARKGLEMGAELICLRLMGCNPDRENRPVAEAVRVVKDVLAGMPAPLIIWGCGNKEKDNELFPVVAEAAAGENCLLGSATQDNYKTLAAVCMAYKHKLVGESPCDVNIAKQVNILVADMGFPISDTVIYPTSAALGYGLEYIYSVMERIRLAGLKGDAMLAQPILSDIGVEVWGVKEARVTEAEIPEWGPQKERAPLWEAATAGMYCASGADMVILRHPLAVEILRKTIAGLAG